MDVSPAKHEVATAFNDRMKLCFDYVKEYLKGCHIIEFPDNVVGDINHKWGRALLHYVQEYYDYALKAVDIITQNTDGNVDEKVALEQLKVSYEKYYKINMGKFYEKHLNQTGVKSK